MTHFPFPQIILVPQGAEYQAVCRGLSGVQPAKPLVLPIPVGPKPVTEYLERWQESEAFLSKKPTSILVMGLGGSLSSQLAVGDVVFYHDCVYQSSEATPVWRSFDGKLTALLQGKLKSGVSLVKGFTSDRIICSADEKRHLSQLYDTQVVDMEGFAALQVLSQAGVPLAMLRVISDDSRHNLPNFTAALTPEGALQPLPLAIAMIRQPIAATRLIRGAMQGLRALQNVTMRLFSQ